MQDQKGNIGVIISFIIIVCLIGFVIYLLMNKPIKTDPLEGINKVGEVEQSNGENETQKESQLSNNQNNQNKMNPNTKTLKDFTPIAKVASLEKIDVIKGEGKEVKAGDTVSVHYTGAVASTGVIFQSSKDFGTEPVTFPLSNVIKGWTDGIPGMKIGGIRRLVIPSEMAYGANPPGGSGIPANADLVFDVELVDIK